MKNYGYCRVASSIPAVKVGDCMFNAKSILSQIKSAQENGVSVICFPELCLTGYTCGDLFSQKLLLKNAQRALEFILSNNVIDIISIVGMPLEVNNVLFNCAVVIQDHRILGIVPKTYIPNYKEFYEKRWFESGSVLPTDEYHIMDSSYPFGKNLIFRISNEYPDIDFTFGIEICEDVWTTIPPSSSLALHGAEIIFNLSASNDIISKHAYLKQMLSQQSAKCMSGYVYSSCGFGESTQDLVFGGKALIYENGNLLKESSRFELDPQTIIADIDIERISSDRRGNTNFGQSLQYVSRNESKYYDIVTSCYNYPDYDRMPLERAIIPHPFVPSGNALDERCEEIFSIQVMGLAQRIRHVNAGSIVIGVSGGLDSTLALLVCVKTMDKLQRSRKDIIGVTMPGFGTTGRTYKNSISLMKELGVTIREISIKDACIQHFKDIGHDMETFDVTYENGQARERTQILMDVANQTNGFVVGTGDLSELALGWCTYNADHMSNYSVNCSIPKTLVRHLVAWVSSNSIDKAAKKTLDDIINTPISPELTPADEKGNIKQKTEDLVGPYELHDFFLYNFLRCCFRPEKIYFLACKVFALKSNKGNPGYGNRPSYYDESTIKKWLTVFCRRFFTQQFKRSCLPDGPKVGSVSLSPRGDWRMPSDASFREWVEECDNIGKKS